MPVDVPAKTAVFQPSQALHWTFLPKDMFTNQEQQSLMFNGHTVQAQGFDYITILNYKGKNYELLQFHFHTPSENRVDGKAYASEMHLYVNVFLQCIVVIVVTFCAWCTRPATARYW